MVCHIDLQHACDDLIPIEDAKLIDWAALPLKEHRDKAELTLRLVSPQEMTKLNFRYRQQNKATNVLAFPSTIPYAIDLDYPLLGDVIICPAVLEAESLELGKPLSHHWAHIIIHGVLHLLGYDHIKKNEAKLMQSEEIKLLARLGIADPYNIEGENIEQRG